MNQKNPKIPKQRTGYRGGLRVYTGKEKVGVKTLIERERKKRERWWRRGNNGSRSRQRVFSSGFLRKKKKKRVLYIQNGDSNSSLSSFERKPSPAGYSPTIPIGQKTTWRDLSGGMTRKED